MQNIDGIFHMRWILWGIGVIWIPFLIFRQMGLGELLLSIKALNLFHFRDRLKVIPKILRLKEKSKFERPASLPETEFRSRLFFLCSIFFLLGFVAKCSQLWSLSLNAHDFWLFVDLLEQGKKGGMFLTRFAPQHDGFVQHGTVHPFLFWMLFTPLSYLTNSVAVSLLYNPLMLSLAGWMIGILSFRRWGSTGAFIFTFSFLASTHVGKILMYDVHPESAYPFLLFLTFWSFGWDGSRTPKRWFLPLCLLSFCFVKEDSFLILGPWIAWGLFFRRVSEERKLYWLALAILVFSTGAQMFLIGELTSGSMGKLMWQGESVYHSAKLSEFGEMDWSSVENAVAILKTLVERYGGVAGGSQRNASIFVV